MGNSSIEEFLNVVSQSQNQIDQNTDPEGKKWIIENLAFETKKLRRQSEAAKKELEKIKKEAVASRIRTLKRTNSNDSYGDLFNQAVCLAANQFGVNLPEAEIIIRNKIEEGTGDKEIDDYLSETIRSQEEKKLKNLLMRNVEKLENVDIAIVLTSIQFELDQIKTDKIWGADKFEQILISGLSGEKVNIITMLCLINQFDYNGGYTSVPDLFVYLKNPKLEPVPLIVDEMTLIPKFFDFYGIESSLTIYIADTDYTEIGEFGPVNMNNIKNIKEYIQNVKDYLKDNSKINVSPISKLTDGNPLYNNVKEKILANVKDFKDPDFTREWYQKFEDDFEKRSQSQGKRKLFSPKEIRQKTLDLTRNIWACNAAQGAVFGTLDQNTILLSTERRERDRNYTIDKDSRKNFPPIIYVLKAAENWNRKIVQKGT